MDMKVGDTAIIRGKIIEIYSGGVVLNAGSDSLNKLTVHRNRITEVIPAPVIPKAGEVWIATNFPDTKAHIVWADDKTVVYTNTSNGPRASTPINTFKQYYTKS